MKCYSVSSPEGRKRGRIKAVLYSLADLTFDTSRLDAIFIRGLLTPADSTFNSGSVN